MGSECPKGFRPSKRGLGYMPNLGVELTQPRTRYDETLGRETENLPTLVVESVNKLDMKFLIRELKCKK
ncbi:hypothetical protein HRbin06_00330 [archaeon HR06]|nr:hypothetical protein HRbin06_00330 [archaeon HR06]